MADNDDEEVDIEEKEGEEGEERQNWDEILTIREAILAKPVAIPTTAFTTTTTSTTTTTYTTTTFTTTTAPTTTTTTTTSSREKIRIRRNRPD